MRKMKIVLLTLIMLLVLTGCQEKQTFTEFLLEQDFECELDVCTESILDEGVDTVESYTWSSNKSSTYHEISDKFVINYVYTYLWDSGGTAVNTIDITIYISNENVRVTSSYTYLSNDGSFWVKSEPEATSFLDGRGWSCRGTRVALEYCGDLNASVDRGLESFRTLYNIYEK